MNNPGNMKYEKEFGRITQNAKRKYIRDIAKRVQYEFERNDYRAWKSIDRFNGSVDSGIASIMNSNNELVTGEKKSRTNSVVSSKISWVLMESKMTLSRIMKIILTLLLVGMNLTTSVHTW